MFEQHQPMGTLPIVAFALATLAAVWATIVVPAIGVVTLVLVAVIAFIASRFTVRVGQGVVEWHFRGGFWRKEMKLSEIVGAEAVQTPWWYGVGIRNTPRGWLYNAGGRGAVEITNRNGKRVLVGSEAPEILAETIRKRMSGRAQ